MHSPCVFKPYTFLSSPCYSFFFFFEKNCFTTASCHTIQKECIFNSSAMMAVPVFHILILWRFLQFKPSALQTTYLFLCLLLLHLYTCCTNTLHFHWSLWTRTFTFNFLKWFHLLNRRITLPGHCSFYGQPITRIHLFSVFYGLDISNF